MPALSPLPALDPKLPILVLLVGLLGVGFAAREVVTPHVRVIYAEPGHADYARGAAAEAERALAALAPLWGPAHGRVTLTLDASTDVFNAFATVVPHPGVVLRPLFPTEDELGYGARDPLFMLLVHELTHVRQLGYGELPPGVRGLPDLGLVGQDLAPPPAWFLEGVATYLESLATTGGRLQDPRTRGLLQSLALSDRWPTLAEAGLATYDAWPGGQTRYLLGANFIDYLVRQYGWDAVLRTLRAYNAARLTVSFAGAWRAAAGTDLFGEWEAWRAEVRAAAEMRAKGVRAGRLLTDTGRTTGAPALSPDGARLAWRSWPSSVMVAELGADGALRNRRTLIEHRAPGKLAWLDAHTLVYARVAARPGRAFSELFALDVNTGAERQLTHGARAHLPAVTPEGCVLYLRDVLGEGSSLRRWCGGEVDTVARAPQGAHFVGLAVSERGRVALSLWRRGFVDLALLEDGRLELLTQDPAPDLDPAWWGEGRLLFRSARTAAGVYDLYALEPGSRRLMRLSRTLGGAFTPVAASGALLYVELGPRGYDLARLERPLGTEAAAPLVPLPGEAVPGGEGGTYQDRPYDPWPSLVPYGWLPTGGRLSLEPFGIGLQAAVLGQDLSGKHSYALLLGYDSGLAGMAGGAYASLRYDHGAGGLLGLAGSPEPLSFGVQLGLWPHAPHLGAVTETALGAAGSLTLRLPLDQWLAWVRLRAGLLRLESYAAGHALPWQFDGRVDAALSSQHADDWGYPTRGWRFGATGLWSATPAGPSPGLWGEAGYVLPLGDGALSFELRAGYRQAPLLPVALGSDLAATARAGYRYSLPLGWRLGDGKIALERLSLAPRLGAWWGAEPGVGADLTLGLDTVLGYSAPVALTGTVGYAAGWWYALGLQVP